MTANNSYTAHINISPVIVTRLVAKATQPNGFTAAERQTRSTAAANAPFKLLNKKQQNALIMRMLGKINNQILKFNVKKLFQIWAIYHPEDVNCQIVSQLMFKGPPSAGYIETIRQDLLRKNRKIRKNSTAAATTATRAGSSGSYNAALLAGEYCCINTSYATITVMGGGGSASQQQQKRSRQSRRQRLEAYKVPSAVDLQLFRSLDKRGVLNCVNLFDVTAYHVTDLPLLMCYTDYHVKRLIDVCRKSRAFPVHLLPVHLRRDVETLLRL